MLRTMGGLRKVYPRIGSRSHRNLSGEETQRRQQKNTSQGTNTRTLS